LNPAFAPHPLRPMHSTDTTRLIQSTMSSVDLVHQQRQMHSAMFSTTDPSHPSNHHQVHSTAIYTDSTRQLHPALSTGGPRQMYSGDALLPNERQMHPAIATDSIRQTTTYSALSSEPQRQIHSPISTEPPTQPQRQIHSSPHSTDSLLQSTQRQMQSVVATTTSTATPDSQHQVHPDSSIPAEPTQPRHPPIQSTTPTDQQPQQPPQMEQSTSDPPPPPQSVSVPPTTDTTSQADTPTKTPSVAANKQPEDANLPPPKSKSKSKSKAPKRPSQVLCSPHSTSRGKQLTVEQRVFVVSRYMETGSTQAAIDLFTEHFPGVKPPTKHTVLRNVQKYRDHGSSHNRYKGNSGRKATIRTEETIEAVRKLLNDQPTTSTRKNGLGLSQSTFQRIVKNDLKWHPYKNHQRHQLTDKDIEMRTLFSKWFAGYCSNEHFVSRFVIGGEASFELNGRVNSLNTRLFTDKNDLPTFTSDRKKLFLWVGLCGNGSLLGPYFFDSDLNDQAYLTLFDTKILPSLLQSYESNIVGLWWVPDSKVAILTKEVREQLSRVFGNNVLAPGCGVQWPAKSPDLNPMDYFFWGYLKKKVFANPPASLEIMEKQIQDACDEIRQTNVVSNAMQELKRRTNSCIQRKGQHLEEYV